MTEPFTDDLCWDASLDRDRGVSVAQIVQPD